MYLPFLFFVFLKKTVTIYSRVSLGRGFLKKKGHWVRLRWPPFHLLHYFTLKLLSFCRAIVARQSGCGAERADNPKGRCCGADGPGRDRLVVELAGQWFTLQSACWKLRLLIAGSYCALYPAGESHGSDPGALEQQQMLSGGTYLCRVRGGFFFFLER